LIIGLNLGLWIYTEISVYLLFNSALIWAAGFILRLSYMRCKAQIHFTSLFKTAPYFNRSISPRFTCAHQYLCYCDLLTLRSMEAPRFALLVAPAIETIFSRSDNCLSIVSSWGVVLRYLIGDPYGESRYALVSNRTNRYRSVPNHKSHKFNTISCYF
jgi:hypothetical protein